MYRLREIERRDIPVINGWRSDYELSKKLGGGFHYVNEEVDVQWYESYLSQRGNAVRCSIVDVDSDAVVGVVYLLNIERVNRTAEIHIMIGEASNRSKGAGTFGMKEMLAHAFNDLNLHRVELEVLEDNHAALRLYEKLGFKREGLKRDAVYKDGGYRNLIAMACLQEECVV